MSYTDTEVRQLQIDLQCYDTLKNKWRNHGVDYGCEIVAILAQQRIEYELGMVCRLVRHMRRGARRI